MANPLLPVKTVINIAKAYIGEVFGDEGAFNVGLEEVTFDGDTNLWEVTVGFSRPWDSQGGNALLPQSPKRTYKVVDIDGTGKVIAVRNRPQAAIDYPSRA